MKKKLLIGCLILLACLVFSPALAETVILPADTTEIESEAFLNCTSITEVAIPEGVTAIGERAFAGCTGLTAVNLPGSVASIGADAFFDCPEVTYFVQSGSYAEEWAAAQGLTAWSYLPMEDGGAEIVGYSGTETEVAVPAHVSASIYTISSACFGNNTALTRVTLLEGIRNVGEAAFAGCTALEDVEMPWSLRTIGPKAFMGCTALLELDLSWNVQVISEYAFAGCTSMLHISSPPGALRWIEAHAFSDCTSLERLSFFEGLKGLGEYAFSGCTKMSIVTFPDGLQECPANVFDGCEELMYVLFGEGMTETHPAMFQNKKALHGVEFPESLTTISARTFEGCTMLLDMWIPGKVTMIGEYAYAGCERLETVNIPDSVTHVGSHLFSGCMELNTVKLSAGMKTIPERMFEGCVSLEKIDIPAGVTEIEAGAFAACTGLTSITLPDTITSLGEEAFLGCAGLSTLTLTSSVEYIAENAIDGQTLLVYPGSYAAAWAAEHGCAHVLIEPESVWEFEILADGTACVSGYTGVLQDLTIPETLNDVPVTAVAAGMLSGSDTLTSVILSNHIASIGEGAFSGCMALREATLPAGLQTIGARAFENCAALSGVKLPMGLVGIGSSAFSGCVGLTDVTIHEAVAEIGDGAFGNCTNLTLTVMSGSCAENWAALNGIPFVVSTPVTYRALLVGNSYPGTEDELRGVDTDLGGMMTILDSMNGYQVRMRMNLTSGQILSQIAASFADADENDVSLFYFGGHGTESGYLVGSTGYVTPRQLRTALDEIPGTKIVLLDCCYSGMHIDDGSVTVQSRGEPSDFNSAVIFAFASKTRGDGNVAAPGYQVITACAKDELSWMTSMDGEHWWGLFTYGICYGSGYDIWEQEPLGGLPADTNGDQAVTLYEAYTCAQERVDHVPVFVWQTVSYYGDNNFVLWHR